MRRRWDVAIAETVKQTLTYREPLRHNTADSQVGNQYARSVL